LRYSGLPDRQWMLLESLRQFPVVIWYTGGSPSLNLKNSVSALTQYMMPSEPGATPGHLLLISKAVTGAATTNLPQNFVTNVLGIKWTPAPPIAFNVPVGKKALGQRLGILPDFSSTDAFNQQALGLQAQNSSTEALYKLESYQYTTRPPYDPIVGVRVPPRASAPAARAVVLSLQLEYFNLSETTAALRGILQNELGVTVP
jgi:hypothetical protein